MITSKAYGTKKHLMDPRFERVKKPRPEIKLIKISKYLIQKKIQKRKTCSE